MAGKCTVCAHAQSAEINKLLVANRSYRVIAGQFGVAFSSLQRHVTKCVAEQLDAAREAQVLERAVITENAVKDVWEKIRMQIDLAHEWLLDPNDRTKYTLDPRADNVQVVYYDVKNKDPETGKAKRMHGDLQELLYRLDKEGYDVDKVKLPKVDYTRLMLDAADKGARFLELLGKLRGEFVKAQKNPMDADTKEDLILRTMERRSLTRDEAVAWLKTKYANVREFADLR
jgi:hypothetical protein